ncbi:peptidoglycan/LPS O-acetylase OafA/YrhL [Microbacterium sp. SORGH_AS428]|uniref:acyltransferase family protein n=1 Tax=Microbacterium sp. SORGH_AS_0428 TaxID=3041788 RepID=UPI00285FA6C1|nr:acyltransferase family protein [Microbacterium sp. SORGH_AS_0428]MDR6199305.1 peptidoglycan/LPS O-acetylase OafA/YrhL [Microbacterium sp. SORGH_AS_0428]
MPSGAAVGQIAPEGAKKRTFRPDIQGLRAVAVIVVILDHLIGWPPGGFVGVDVFFVISGFLITGLLLREHARTGSISFTGFYLRRAKRILPAAILVVAFSVVAGYLLFNRARAEQTALDGIWSTFFAANWRFASLGTDYFNADSGISPLQHFWSLAVEEQFYFIWPWLMLAIFSLLSLRSTQNSRTAHRVIGLTMFAIVLASFVWALHETQTNPNLAYFSTFSRAWELGVGALIAVAAGRFERIPLAVRTALGWIGLSGIAAALFVIHSDTGGFPAPWAMLPVLSTACVIIAGTGGEQRYLWPLMNPVSSWIGDVSYSLYIWHFPLIVFGIALFGGEPAVLAGIFVATFVISWVSYTLVEDPLRRSRWYGMPAVRRPRRSKRLFPDGLWRGRDVIVGVVALGLAVAGLSTAAITERTVSPPNGAYTPPVTGAQMTPTPTDTTSSTPELDALQADLAASLTQTRWPDDLTPTMDDAIRESQAPSDVMPCGSENRVESDCAWGDPAATHTILMVGNSVSMTYVEAVRTAIGNDRGWRVVAWGMFGCPFTDWNVDNINDLDVVPEGCAQRHDQAVDAINSVNPDLVLVSGIGSREGTASQLQKITAQSQVMFMIGPPTDKNPKECFTPTSSPADCVSSLPTDWGGREAALSTFGERIDTRPWFCHDAQCPPFAGTVPMKMDRAHMTAEYAQRIAPVIREYFATSVPNFPGA